LALNLGEAKDFQDKHKEYLNKLKEVDSKDYVTKKALVIRLIEVTRPLIENGFIGNLNISDLASYINNRLEEYDIKYPRNQDFYNLFTEIEKREYGTNLLSTSHRNHVHQFGDEDVAKCECGAILFEALIYERQKDRPEEEDETEDVTAGEKTQTSQKELIDPYQNNYTEYIQRVKFNCQELASQSEDLVKKYCEEERFAKAIESAISKPSKLIDEQKSVEAMLIKTRKQSDFRQKIGEFEKLKSIMLWKAGHIHSHIAKILAITPKHLSHNILKNMDGYIKTLKWFGTIKLKCTFCKEEMTYNLSDWYEEQVARKSLDLPMEQPLLNN